MILLTLRLCTAHIRVLALLLTFCACDSPPRHSQAAIDSPVPVGTVCQNYSSWLPTTQAELVRRTDGQPVNHDFPNVYPLIDSIAACLSLNHAGTAEGVLTLASRSRWDADGVTFFQAALLDWARTHPRHFASAIVQLDRDVQVDALRFMLDGPAQSDPWSVKVADSLATILTPDPYLSSALDSVRESLYAEWDQSHVPVD